MQSPTSIQSGKQIQEQPQKEYNKELLQRCQKTIHASMQGKGCVKK